MARWDPEHAAAVDARHKKLKTRLKGQFTRTESTLHELYQLTQDADLWKALDKLKEARLWAGAL